MAKNNFPDWRDHEKQMTKLISHEYPYARIVANEHILGILSHSRRQIDICIYDASTNVSIGIVECKYLGKKVDLPIIDSLVGKMKDVAANFAIVCSAIGFTKAAKQLARASNSELKTIQFGYLKDYDFIEANFLADELIQETEYYHFACDKCQVINLYEVKVIRGFSEDEDVSCPQCKSVLFVTRTDGGHRVIKRIPGLVITENEFEQYIVEHLLETRKSWGRKLWSFSEPILNEDQHCKVCSKKFDLDLFGSYPVEHEDHLICIECDMSSRTLLLDHNKL